MTALTPAPAAEARSAWLWKWGLRLTSLALAAGLWEVLGRTQHNLLLPSFSGALAALLQLLSGPALWSALWVSNQALGVGFGAALFVGIPLGLASGRFTRLDKTLSLYISLLLMTPMAALIPLFIAITGLGLVSRALIVFIFALPFIIINTRTGVQQVHPSLIDIAYSFGAQEGQIWLKVLLPGAWPAMLTGVRVGLGRAITAMVLVDFLFSAEGLGRLLLEYQGAFESASVYAIMLIVIAEALLLLRVIRYAEQRFSRTPSGVVVK